MTTVNHCTVVDYIAVVYTYAVYKFFEDQTGSLHQMTTDDKITTSTSELHITLQTESSHKIKHTQAPDTSN